MVDPNPIGVRKSPVLSWALLSWLSLCPLLGVADDWPRFRGPNGCGIDSHTALPTDLRPESATWSTELAGTGHSSPVIFGRQLFATSYLDSAQQLSLECFDQATGRRLWQWTMPLAKHPMHRLNNPAASTPAVDSQHVYILATEPNHLYLIALNHDGSEAWRRDFGHWTAQHGFGTSPMIVDDRIVFVDSQEPQTESGTPQDSRIIAVDATTGKDRWQTEISGKRACYAVPIVFDDQENGRCLIGSSFGEGIYAVDAATGKMLWKQPCFQQRIVGSPIIHDDLVFGNNGSGGGGNFLAAIGLKDHAVRYELHQSISYVPTLLAFGQRLYVVADNGVISCYRISGGEPLYRERVSDGFWASPVCDGTNLFCIDKNGEVFVLAIGDEYRLIGRYPLGEATEATPAISNGQLIIRTASKLFCFRHSSD